MTLANIPFFQTKVIMDWLNSWVSISFLSLKNKSMSVKLCLMMHHLSLQEKYAMQHLLLSNNTKISKMDIIKYKNKPKVEASRFTKEKKENKRSSDK